MGDFFLRLQALKNGTAKPDPPKETKRIPPVSAKQKEKLKAEQPQRAEKSQWFLDRIAESKGRCMECGCSINKNNVTFAIMTVAHVLPKRKGQFPSVATHKDNSLELCVTNGCHDRYDKTWGDAAQMKVWPLAVKKFLIIYPSIAPAERKNIPDVLMQELEPRAIIATHITDLNTTLIEPA